MKPICVPCQRFFRPKKNDFFFIEGMPISGNPEPGISEPERWTAYKIWAGDRWECEGCHASIVVGVAHQPIREHYMPDFNDVRQQLRAEFQVNDC